MSASSRAGRRVRHLNDRPTADAPPNLGLPARGARPLRPDDGARPAVYLPALWHRLAAAAEDARSTGSESPGSPTGGRAAVEGQPAEVQFIAAILHDPDVLIMASRSPASTRSTPPSPEAFIEMRTGQDPHLQHPPDGLVGSPSRSRSSTGAGRRRRAAGRHQEASGRRMVPPRRGGRRRPRLKRSARLAGRRDRPHYAELELGALATPSDPRRRPRAHGQPVPHTQVDPASRRSSSARRAPARRGQRHPPPADARVRRRRPGRGVGARPAAAAASSGGGSPR